MTPRASTRANRRGGVSPPCHEVAPERIQVSIPGNRISRFSARRRRAIAKSSFRKNSVAPLPSIPPHGLKTRAPFAGVFAKRKLLSADARDSHHAGTTPGRRCTSTDRRCTTPARRCTSTGRRGSKSERRCTLPERRGSTTERRDTAARRRATLCERRGRANARRGSRCKAPKTAVQRARNAVERVRNGARTP